MLWSISIFHITPFPCTLFLGQQGGARCHHGCASHRGKLFFCCVCSTSCSPLNPGWHRVKLGTAVLMFCLAGHTMARRAGWRQALYCNGAPCWPHHRSGLSSNCILFLCRIYGPSRHLSCSIAGFNINFYVLRVLLLYYYFFALWAISVKSLEKQHTIFSK